jgi:hypothetical protein
MVQSPLPDRLSIKVRTIEDVFARDGMPIRSMKKAGSLETMPGVNGNDDPPARPLFQIDRLEDVTTISPRAVARIAPSATQFRYFLDGAQKTLPVWRVGVVPIVISYAVVGILERGEAGDARLLPGSLRDEHIWLIPRRTGLQVIDNLIEYLEDHDEKVIDPIDDHPRAHKLDYDTSASEFSRLVDCSYATANDHRAFLEQEVLAEWKTHPERRFPDAWMVVDGRLRDNHDHCIGLVKNLLTQHLRGKEAEALFDLEQGHRTTAFRIAQTPRDDAEFEEREGRTNWYMRFWNADGFDARHALIRIEAPHQVQTTDEIDEIASWIMAERLPRPTDDPRWPTLLYPIHYLEKILKRKLASITTGWPA